MSRSTFPPARKILIAACGDIGARLASQLLASSPLADGDPAVQIWGLRRRPELLPAGVRPLEGDLTQPRTLGDWPTFDAVVATPVPATDAADKGNRYRRGYLDAALGLLEHLRNQGQKPCVFWTSSTAVYAGLAPAGCIDEETEPKPADGAGEVLLQAEQAVQDSGLPCCILRPAGIYGPGRTALLQRAFAAPPDETTPEGAGNRMHSEDCASAVAHLLRQILRDEAPVADSLAPLYLLSDGQPAPRSEIIRWLRQQMQRQGLAPADNSQPAGTRRSAGRGTASPITNRRLLQSGYRLRYPDWRIGYGELLADFVRQRLAAGQAATSDSDKL